MPRAGRSTGRALRLHIAEPRAAYLHRPSLVVDASIIAAALFDEDAKDEAVALMHGRALHAPHLLDYEIANVGLTKQRREKVAVSAVETAIEAFTRLPIERHAVDVATIASVAARYALTAYDAAYLCVAEQLTAPLATLDGKLAAAARTHLARDREIHEP
jgi:predicted nucleic acid-binding protein